MSGTQEENNLKEFDIKKTVAYLILAIFLIVLLVLVYNFKEKYLKNYSPLSGGESNAVIADLIDIDSYEAVRSGAADDNGDGLSNWREMIYGSSAAGVSTNLSRDEDNIVISSSTNLTELLSRDLYVAAEYNKGNSNISATSLVNAIDKNYSNLLKSNEAITLNVITRPTFEERREYGNRIGLFFRAIFTNGVEVELGEVGEESQKFVNTKKKLKDLLTICEFSKILPGIPLDVQNLHLEFIDSCDKYVAVLDGLSKSKEDPYRSIIALSAHRETTLGMYLIYKKYQNIFSESKYKYNSNEYGVIFNVIQ